MSIERVKRSENINSRKKQRINQRHIQLRNRSNMNPANYEMFWMNQYSQDRMVLDDSSSYYSQPSIGMSVMDDISHQANAMVSF